MAQLLEPLGLLAQRADQPLVGSTPEDFIAPYTTDGWEADLAAWQAMDMAGTAHEEVVRQAVAALLRPGSINQPRTSRRLWPTAAWRLLPSKERSALPR